MAIQSQQFMLTPGVWKASCDCVCVLLGVLRQFGEAHPCRTNLRENFKPGVVAVISIRKYTNSMTKCPERSSESVAGECVDRHDSDDLQNCSCLSSAHFQHRGYWDQTHALNCGALIPLLPVRANGACVVLRSHLAESEERLKAARMKA